MLPENVLLDIFCFYKEDHDQPYPVWKWHLLVHICQRWRQLVFASQLRLDLRISFSSRNLVGKDLGIWPVFPICVDFDCHSDRRDGNNAPSEDNIVTVLGHVDRVCYVRLGVTGSELGKISGAMQKPFPVLTTLRIISKDGDAPVLPAEFLGGSAPRLQEIHLDSIPFPALPTLLLSTSDLIEVDLWSTPPTGYISPEAMVACLAALPRLHTFAIGFRSATSRPDQIHPPPVMRTVLPALTRFNFRGATEYLEDLVSRIDTPQLDAIHISYLIELVDFRVPQLARFIGRSVSPKLTQFRYAQITFYSNVVIFNMSHHANGPYPNPAYSIFYQGIAWPVLHIARLLNHVSATLTNVVRLKLEVLHQLEGPDNVGSWLHLLQQFPTVHTLHVSRKLSGCIALVLESITGESVAEVLPSLGLIYLADQPASSVEKFVASRRLSDRPVTVVETEIEFNEKLESYVSK